MPHFAGTALAQDPGQDAARAALAAERADRQSPINIITADVADRPNATPLIVSYPTDVDMEVEYVDEGAPPVGDCGTRGAEDTVEALHFSQPAFVRFNGARWDLLQFHFHRRSEHQVDGEDFPIEQHFVHARADGKILVVGVFLTRGGHAPQDRVLATLPQEFGTHIFLSGINMKAMLPNDLTAYRYPGSLTTGDTEPYVEGVRWNVIRERVRIQDDSIDRFRQLFPDGVARPTQQVNDRNVRLVRGRFA